MLQTLSGRWIKNSTGEFRGEVGTELRALAVEGDEEETGYDIGTTITIVKGTKASIIVFYHEDEIIKYLEMVLDTSSNIIKLDKVEDDERTNVDSVDYNLELGKTYECFVRANSDGVIQCVVNGSVLIQTSVDGYLKGQHGFACDGSDVADYSLFDKRYFQKQDYYVHISDAVSALRSIDHKEIIGKNGTVQDYFDYLIRLIEQTCRFFDSETNHVNGFFQKGGITVTEYFDGKGVAPSDIEFEECIKTWREKAATFLLDQRPILSVATIEENKAIIGATDDWQLITAHRHHAYGHVVLSSGSIPMEGIKNVRIVYVAGYTKTPSDVQGACLHLIENYVKKFISDKTSAFVSFARPQAVNFAMPEVLTSDIKATINRYKLVSFGEM